MGLRRRYPQRVDAAYPTVRNVSLTLFGLVVLGAIATEQSTVVANATAVGGAALALNVAAMSISFGISKLARLDDRQATAISLELGIHNAALAIAVGASLSDEVTVPAAVYASFMLFTGGGFAWAMSRRNAAAEDVDDPLPTATPALEPE
jgi:BASS family bile acid:Na+ symporter